MRVHHPASPLLAAACLAALVACGGEGDPPRGSDTAVAGATPEPGGTLVLVVAGAPSHLLPPLVRMLPEKQIADLLYERLADIGPSLNTLGDGDFRPGLARSWEWSADSQAITFRLDSAARWHDGRPVTSQDVRFTVATAKDPALGSTDGKYLAIVDSVATPDAHTAVFWFGRRTPEQFYDAAGRLSILPAHVLRDVKPAELRHHPAATRPIGSGRFRFARARPGEFVELAADTSHHLGRPMLDRVVMVVAADPVAATARLFAGEADMFEALRPENMAEVAARPELVAHVGPSTAYSFLQFNFRDPADSTRPHPILGDPALRRALAMAVDRPAIVRSVMDTLGVTGAGPFPRGSPVADTTAPIPRHDRAAAVALLDSLGWKDSDGDGVRDRNGRQLSLVTPVPEASALRARTAIALQQQLAAVGVKLDLRQLEFRAWGELTMSGKFDATMNSWVLTDWSPAGLRSTWGTAGSQNYGRYGNPVFDAHVDSGNAAFDLPTRRAHFRQAFKAMAPDVPALWIYEPHNTFAVHRRFRTPAMRATGWWLDLPQWWIPSAERIARDAPPAPTVARQ